MKKIIGIGISLLLSMVLLVAPSWAIDVSPGDRVALKATSDLGVPLHESSSSSLVGRALDGTIATVLDLANGDRWLQLELPDGTQRWIVEKYVDCVIGEDDGCKPITELGEVTTLVAGPDTLTVAAMNVENLDPSDGDRLGPLGEVIVESLAAPDIIVLTEVQDNDGPQESGITEATQTYNDLIAAIKAAAGPDYIAFDIAPVANMDGGQPGGNIRVGYIYQPDRVALAVGAAGGATDAVQVLAGPTLSLNPGRIDPKNSAFDNSRKPLAAEFQFNQQPVFIVGNHFASKRRDSNDAQRAEQAALVADFAEQLLLQDSDANVIVAGDLNDLDGSQPIERLKSAGLANLSDLLEESDRYTYEFRRRLQQLDYIFASSNLVNAAKAEFDIVYVNINKPNAVSDHEPVLARFTLADGSVNPPVTQQVILPGLSGAALRSQLATDYRVQNSLGYKRARDFMYAELDNDNGSLRGIYSDFTVQVDPNSSTPRADAFQNNKGINAEHVWPQSKGARQEPAKSDLHHLFPARVKVNSLRGNSPFAEIDDAKTDRWLLNSDEVFTIPLSSIDDYSEYISGAFEPREAVKGDIARAMFYFNTIYGNQAEPGFFDQQVDTLCEWNEFDPVDEAELGRSHAIASRQGNENPFVLDPTLANRLYCR